MKNIIIIFLLLNIHHNAFSQTKADFENAMNRFKNFYNNNQADSIQAMFYNYKISKRPTWLWSQERLPSIKKEYGEIQSVKYLLVDTVSEKINRITLFRVKTQKDEFVTGLTLHENFYLGTFRFKTSSPYIDSVFKASKL